MLMIYFQGPHIMLWMLNEATENSAKSIASLKGKAGRFSVSGYYFYRAAGCFTLAVIGK